MSIRFGSVCSGIEAASVAFGPLGWEAAWFAEIEPFPSAALAHHYPNVPNLGDMTTIAARIDSGEVEAPDALVGGTPCQAFSVAGLRRSLEDARGNLSLEFIRIADAIDRVRRRDGKPPCWVKWENVPGVLSTRDNAFGALLGGLCGSDTALDAPADGWPSAGVVAGPSRVVAWRVLDAQFFGVAQRRKRVFVLALGGPGAWACADALLPVSDRMQWHPAPSREARQGAAGGAALSVALRGRDGGATAELGDEVGFGLRASSGGDKPHVLAFGGNNRGGAIDIAAGLNAKGGAGRMDFDSETFITTATLDASYGRLQGASGQDANHGHSHLVPVAFQAADYESGAFDQVEHAAPLTTSADRSRAAPILAFTSKDHGADAMEDCSPTLRAGGHSDSHANAGVPPAVQQAMQVRRLTPRECERLQGFPDDYTAVPHRGKPAADGPRYKAIGNSWAVPCVRWIGQRINEVRKAC